MNMTKRVVLLGTALAGLCVTVPAAPAALAATASGPAPMTPYGGGASVVGHTVIRSIGSGTTMHGWQIALIAMATALVIAIGDRALIRARAARHPLAGAG
jgi:hypothetical protein